MIKKLIQWKLRAFGKFLEATSGWKSYTAASLMIAYSVLGLVFGLHEVDKAAEVFIGALALIGVAHKLEKR